MKLSKTTAALCTTMLLSMTACHKKHPVPIVGDHQNEKASAIHVNKDDEIDWSVDNSAGADTYTVCFEGSNKPTSKPVCTNKDWKPTVTRGTTDKCIVDVNQLPHCYDVTQDPNACGVGGYKACDDKHLDTAHCDGCIIDNGP